MNFPYYIKAIYAALITGLNGLLVGILAVGEEAGLGDLTTAAWLVIIIGVLVAGGGILGLQAAPAKVATSIR